MNFSVDTPGAQFYPSCSHFCLTEIFFNGWRRVNKTDFQDKGWVVRDGAIVCTRKKGDTGGYGYGIEFKMHNNGLYDKNSLGSAYDLYEAWPNRKAKKPGGWNDTKVLSRNGK